MPSFDYMADESVKPEAHDWMEQAALLRKFVLDNKALTDKRNEFIQNYAITKPNHRGQGKHKDLAVPLTVKSLGLYHANRSKEEALQSFPQYSARLLLHFKLISPLLSRDDEPFYLIDNPARKDHIFKSPYLSAASVKGLSADAYQRAFPVDNWSALGEKDADRTHAYRLHDGHAVRLFGLADDGVEHSENISSHQQGRLRFSPVWFQKLQFLVLNPKKEETAQGGVPIQFEAVAAEQLGCIEVLYFNPNGSENSNEKTVREDLARWLASVASWWPLLGLGGKRLAGYGQIAIESVTLQTVNWQGMKNLSNSANQAKTKAKTTEKQAPPANYEQFLTSDKQLISEDELRHILKQQAQQLDAEIAKLDDKRRHTQGKAQSKAIKAWEKVKKKQKNQAQQLENAYQKALTYWQTYGQAEQENIASNTVILPEYPIYEKKLAGKNSWLEMAQWIAGEHNG